MKILNSKINLDVFFQQLAESHHNILFLDYDGTLAPFQVRPEKAAPYPGIRKLLKKIQACPDTRLVIVSGRYTRDLIPLLNLRNIPEIWGSHGLERLKPDGTYRMEKIDLKTKQVFKKAREKTSDLIPPNRLEYKPGCLALHWRGLKNDKISEIKNKILPQWTTLANHAQLLLKEFDGGLELRLSGKNKGDAVREVLQETRNDFVCAYLGDDVTDEDAFKALENRGLRALVREQLRETVADIWLLPPLELIEFLRRWIKACET